MADGLRKRILVVDDDPAVRRTIASLLEIIGFHVIGVEGATAALALIASDRPDAILTDIHMAEGDGIELINAVRDQDLKIPIIAMSGLAQWSWITWSSLASSEPQPSWTSYSGLRTSRK